MNQAIGQRDKQGKVPARLSLATIAGLGLSLGALGLTGCAVPKTGPVDWWHDMKGGAIAAQRPPPPGANAPYPNLDSVPPKPSISSASVRKGLTTSLVEERNRMNGRIAADPVLVTGAPSPAKKNAIDPTAAKPQSSADQNPGNQIADNPAPVGEAPIAAASASQSPLSGPPANPDLSVPGPLPDMPNAPPSVPSLPGLVVPNAPRPKEKAPTADLNVQFAPASAVLPPSALPALAELVQQRGTKSILITGGGDEGGQSSGESSGDGPDPDQMMLGLKRAHAVWKALIAAGVPKASLSAQFLSSAKGVDLRLSH